MLLLFIVSVIASASIGIFLYLIERRIADIQKTFEVQSEKIQKQIFDLDRTFGDLLTICTLHSSVTMDGFDAVTKAFLLTSPKTPPCMAVASSPLPPNHTQPEIPVPAVEPREQLNL